MRRGFSTAIIVCRQGAKAIARCAEDLGGDEQGGLLRLPFGQRDFIAAARLEVLGSE